VSRITKKRARFGIKFPDDEIREIAFGSASSSGVVYGVPHIGKHITLIDEKNAFSSHITEESRRKPPTHLGKVLKNEINDRLWLEILKPRKLEDSELDQTMLYFTRKFESLVNIPDEICFKTTDDKSMSYLDLDAISKYRYSCYQNLQKSPDAYLGICPVRKMLSTKDIECGLLLDNGIFLLKMDDGLYGIDLSALREAFSMQDTSVPQNPLSNLLKVLGLTSFSEFVMERLRELVSKTQQ
jgi:hypothetical protein